jgi:hypothetical protein
MKYFEFDELLYLSNDIFTRDDYYYKLQQIKYFDDLKKWLNFRFIFNEPELVYKDLITHEIHIHFSYTWFTGNFNQYYPKIIKTNAEDSIMNIGCKIQDFNKLIVYKENEYANLPIHLYRSHKRKVPFTLHMPSVTVESDPKVIIIIYDLDIFRSKNESRKRKICNFDNE